MATFTLEGNYASRMLAQYLFGQQTAPNPEKIADAKFIRPEDAKTKVEIDASEYMTKVGKNLILANQIMFQLFFNGTKKNGDPVTLNAITAAAKAQPYTEGDTEIVLTHEEFVNLFYGTTDSKYGAALKAELNSDQYTTDTDSDDYWQRAFVFGSTNLQLDTARVRYVFDASTGKALHMKNIYVRPVKDNFDFVSDDEGIGKAMGPILKQIMDPSGIGRTVDIEYTNNQWFAINYDQTVQADTGAVAGGIFSQLNYRHYIMDHTITDPFPFGWPDVPPEPTYNLSAMKKGLEILKASGVYNFRDSQDKVVMFGTNAADTLNGYNAKNLVLNENIDTSSISGWEDPAFYVMLNRITSLGNGYEDYLENGVVYVGGTGSDIITGTEHNDVLIGGQGQDNMDGGAGDDTFLVEGADTARTLAGLDTDDRMFICRDGSVYNFVFSGAVSGTSTIFYSSDQQQYRMLFLDLNALPSLQGLGKGSNGILDGGAGQDRLDGEDSTGTAFGGAGDLVASGGFFSLSSRIALQTELYLAA